MKAITKFLLLIAIVLSSPLMAQEWEKNDPRSMQSIVFDVVGNKDIKLPPASRLFNPIRPQPYQRVNTDLQYSFQSYFYPAEAIALRLRPRPLAAVPEDKLYGNYIKAGVGNYATPFLDLYTSNKRQKEFSYGFRLNYLSSLNGPVDKKNSAQGRLGGGIFGSAYGDKITLSGEALFDRDNLHFYGYDDGTGINPEDIEQFYNSVTLKAGVRNTSEEDDFQVDSEFGLSFQNNLFGAKETDLFVNINTTLQVMENAWSHVDGSFSTISRNDPSADFEGRTFFFARGGLSYKLDDLTIQALLRIDYQSDTLAGDNGVHLYPIASIRYKLLDNVLLEAGIDGGITKTTWNGITDQNLFLDEGQYIAGTIKQSGLYANLKSSLSTSLFADLGLSISNYKNSYYFNNTATDQSRFEILYDTGVVRLFNPHASISYNKDEKYRVGLNVDYFNYKMSELDQPWHKPEYAVTLNTSALIVDKFKINIDVFMLGGIIALENNQEINLDPVIDLNVGLEYFTGSRMSIFLKGMNLIGTNYSLFNHYPVKGIQVLGGVSYKF